MNDLNCVISSIRLSNSTLLVATKKNSCLHQWGSGYIQIIIGNMSIDGFHLLTNEKYAIVTSSWNPARLITIPNITKKLSVVPVMKYLQSIKTLIHKDILISMITEDIGCVFLVESYCETLQNEWLLRAEDISISSSPYTSDINHNNNINTTTTNNNTKSNSYKMILSAHIQIETITIATTEYCHSIRKDVTDIKQSWKQATISLLSTIIQPSQSSSDQSTCIYNINECSSSSSSNNNNNSSSSSNNNNDVYQRPDTSPNNIHTENNIIHSDANHDNILHSSNSNSNRNSEKKENIKLLICGPKGSGKSTCLRYTINTLLSLCPEIAVLDLDVGQPEFSIPGTLSLYIITDPILSSVHLNMRKPIASYFIGSITNKSQPDEYKEVITQLYNIYQERCNEKRRMYELHQLQLQEIEKKTKYNTTKSHYTSRNQFELLVDNNKKDDNDMKKTSSLSSSSTNTSGTHLSMKQKSLLLPLLINTDGYIRYMGNENLSMICNIIHPTHIFQISTDKDKEIPAIESYYHTKCIQYPVYLSRLEPGCISPSHINSSDLRTLRLVSYFLRYSPYMNDRISPIIPPLTNESKTTTITSHLNSLPSIQSSSSSYSSSSSLFSIRQGHITDTYGWLAQALMYCPSITIPFHSILFQLPPSSSSSFIPYEYYLTAFNVSLVALSRAPSSNRIRTFYSDRNNCLYDISTHNNHHHNDNSDNRDENDIGEVIHENIPSEIHVHDQPISDVIIKKVILAPMNTVMSTPFTTETTVMNDTSNSCEQKTCKSPTAETSHDITHLSSNQNMTIHCRLDPHYPSISAMGIIRYVDTKTHQICMILPHTSINVTYTTYHHNMISSASYSSSLHHQTTHKSNGSKSDVTQKLNVNHNNILINDQHIPSYCLTKAMYPLPIELLYSPSYPLQCYMSHEIVGEGINEMKARKNVKRKYLSNS